MSTSDAPDRTDSDDLADALLDAIEGSVSDAAPEPLRTTMAAFRKLGIEFVRKYNRLEIDTAEHSFDDPVLFVANHGFGGIFDLNVFATSAALEQLHLDRDVTILTHQLAWTLGVGRFIEPIGARPASVESAQDAFGRGEHVAVYPGGDIDSAKSWEDRNRIMFGGRTGFARLAIDNGVPIVPIVTAGAGESLFVISSGERLARATRLDKLLRLKSAPISVSLPWGLNIGVVGLLPYLPLPTKLQTRVLPVMPAESGEEPAEYAARVESAMQTALTEMTEGRTPLLG
ncbi:lysophospholipid acyltransferase family protein [Mycolicibacterium neoaurum]|uniref:lysophospholipid acyltransferase family protein n=1 Tax=Mycolicibacterium neoaurum TaxID=1795 RepID=UPI00248D009D|nr:lysophospholipid acyltransferase family protein [Mycolicibacterium neoaurum]WBP93622.1 lysophospholipid acyltransferase family protein [Mycolicibacterium neoaurum]WBS07415.1 lysophospholipid acyltransferase family protein [Mycolicibacterium neoaurum]